MLILVHTVDAYRAEQAGAGNTSVVITGPTAVAGVLFAFMLGRAAPAVGAGVGVATVTASRPRPGDTIAAIATALLLCSAMWTSAPGRRSRPRKEIRMSHLVSIGLPVRNAGSRVTEVVRSVQAQTYTDLELVISDNASTDDTEDVVRALAKEDDRIVYHRQPENVGLLNNFTYVIRAATGTYFRWIGDDDRVHPEMAARCVEVFEADPRLALVTMGISYTGPDGEISTGGEYDGALLGSDDPADRFVEMMRLLNTSHLMIDPLYAMMRRDVVAAIPRRNMLHEDEIFAGKLALAGPWGHVHEVLAHRHWADDSVSKLGKLLNVPAWQWRMRNALQYKETADCVRRADLTAEQRRRALAAARDWYLARQWRLIRRRSIKLVRMATPAR